MPQGGDLIIATFATTAEEMQQPRRLRYNDRSLASELGGDFYASGMDGQGEHMTLGVSASVHPRVFRRALSRRTNFGGRVMTVSSLPLSWALSTSQWVGRGRPPGRQVEGRPGLNTQR